MNKDELIVTLKMIDVKYHEYVYPEDGSILINMYANENVKLQKFLVNLMDKYDLNWNYIAHGGEILGVYTIYYI